MQQNCLKCGHVHAFAGDVPEVACPECGAVYAKVAQAMDARGALPEKAPAARRAPAQWLGVVLVSALALGAYAVYDRQQFRAAVQAREQQRLEQAEAVRADQARARAEQRRVAAEQRTAEEAARRAAMSPWERRQEALKVHFSAWDGSHRAAERAIKARMNNPASYEHVVTTYVDRGHGRGIIVNTRFRGTNAFNAVITEHATVEVDEAGNVTGVKLSR